MQRKTFAPRGGLETRGLLALVSRLGGTPLSPATLDRWIQQGLVAPSLVRSRVRGVSHLWSASDAVLVTWLTRLRADGLEVLSYRRTLRGPGWRRLGAALLRDAPLFLVISGRGTAAVLSTRDLLAHLGAPSRSVLVAWPAIPLDQVRHEAGLLGVADLP